MTDAPAIDIDATGLLCPQPLLRLKAALRDKKAGDKVCIAVTDAHAELDFQVWCERFGHQLAGPINHSDHQLFVVTKAASA